ncbi:uncharacterized hemerythrin-like protein C869.06c [Selaginella moellendorffii]|nr:uncharacterized hemerythrin-like protein C869.06c [Selaginella moellendorffii]|eukprot:XP_002981476.2 uncharacterized hemerythrin-like protein C869.06c [Selaginella moellendorffii]
MLEGGSKDPAYPGGILDSKSMRTLKIKEVKFSSSLFLDAHEGFVLPMALATVARKLVLNRPPLPAYSRRTIPPRYSSIRLLQSKGGFMTQQQQHHEEASAKGGSSSDIIERVKKDHEELDDYYKHYKKSLKDGDGEAALKWFNQFVWEICRHSVSEELVLYPMMETMGDRGKKLADKSREDHHKVKEMLAEMESMSDAKEMEPKMDKLMEELREHIKLEESEDLALVEKEVGLGARETAGATFALGKSIAPTRPHTMVPEKPVVVEAALGLLATPMDKLRDMFTSFPKA